MRQGLRSGDPMQLLTVAGGMVEISDPRRNGPFGPPTEAPQLVQLVQTFVETPYAETTAVLTALRELVVDETVRARIDRGLAGRRHPLPVWLSGMGSASVRPEVWRMSHVLGDGDDYLVSVTMTGTPLTALVYVDHNMGTIVKDAFVIPEPLEQVLARLRQLADGEPDTSFELVDAASARATVEQAIASASRLYPPVESDTWPMCRPVVEWMLRMLPAGGAPAERQEWSAEHRARLIEDILASPLGADLADPESRDVLDTLLWFGSDHGTGDPLIWSPVTVEVLLLDWVPRTVLADDAYLARIPAVLRALVRYGHQIRGIRASLTDETLTAIAQYEPMYLDALTGGDRGTWMDDSDLSVAEIMLERLDGHVGGRPNLLSLSAAPLPDEPVRWDGIADDVRPVVEQYLAECDRVAVAVLDVEHRTAMRRLLFQVARADPAVFRRRSSVARGAAAVAWVIGRANHTVGWDGALEVQHLLAEFDVKGSVSQRAEPLLRAVGVDPHRLYGSMALGMPELLVSGRRAAIIRQRDRYLNAAD